MATTAALPSSLDASSPAPSHCAMCGAALAGRFCQACGQPSRSARRTLREALTGQSGRLLHTLRMLITRPGELAREIDEGRDRDSMRPLTLLLNVIALFFLLSSFTDFRLQAFEQSDKSGRMSESIDRRAAAAGVPRGLYAERIERRFQSAYTLLIPVSSLVYAVALWLTHRGSRKPWLVHVAAAIQFMSVVFLVALVGFVVGRGVGGSAITHPLAYGVVNALCFVYLALMIRNLYAEPWPRVLAKSAVVFVVGSLSDLLIFIVALNAALFLG